MPTSKPKTAAKKKGAGRTKAATKPSIAPPASEPEQELLPALASARKVDDKLVADAVTFLRTTQDRHVREAALEIGAYLYEHFFTKNADQYEANADEHLSLRALSEREGMPKYPWMSRAIRAHLQHAQLPKPAQALPLTHQMLLLPLRNAKTKKALALQAATEGLSKRELEAKIGEARAIERGGGGKSTGRPYTPAFLKGLAQLKIASANFSKRVKWSDPFPGYGDKTLGDTIANTLKTLTAAKKQVTKIKAFISTAEKALKKL